MTAFSIDIKNVHFRYAADAPEIFSGLSLSLGTGARCALVGDNGTGKSTLLRIITGEFVPDAGRVRVDGRCGYLPQKIERSGSCVADMLGVTKTLRALELAESGHAARLEMEELEGKWDLRGRCLELLGKTGLDYLKLDASLENISGGELVRLALCAVMLKKPDILLLDEPTNNLDHNSRVKLLRLLEEWKGPALVASHDRELLSSVDSIAELYCGKCTLHAMRYAEYKLYREQMDAAARARLENSKNKLRQEKQTFGEVMDRRNHFTAASERRLKKNEGVQRLHLEASRNAGETSTAKIRGIHLDRIADAQRRVKDAQRELRPEDRIILDVPQNEIPAGKLILELEDVMFSYDGNPLWGKPLSFYMSGNARMALVGPNGSGKTTVLKLLCGKLRPDSGTVTVSAAPVVCLDQFLEYLDPDKSILDNVLAPGANEALVRTRLARLFFRRETVRRKVAELSGGEKLRVALAKLFCADKPPQLLILDEPTNNLDITSCRQLASALDNFKGAILAVSHDYEFLCDIGAELFFDLTPYCEQ
jgi:ATPase subunit of ABC transporter with duplicated ATPase domains